MHGDKGHICALCRASSPCPGRTFYPRRRSATPSSPAALARREEESLTVPTKRRRVTAEMEGKYIINMPKGTTPRTRKILEQQQAAKGTGPAQAGVCAGVDCASPFGLIPLALAEKQTLKGSRGPWTEGTVMVAIEEGVGHHLCPVS